MPTIGVCGSFDDLRSRHVRFLEEAAKLGAVHVALWSDAAVQAATGRPPKFPQAERQYFVEAIRWVQAVTVTDAAAAADGELPPLADVRPDGFAVEQAADPLALRQRCAQHGVACHVIPDAQLAGFPDPAPLSTLHTPHSTPSSAARKKVLVTGCYDWFHTGHVRFFEEVAEYGDLYAVVGHDANIALLKGPGHPQFRQDERRYLVGAIRFVKQALVSTGNGWLDAEPEIARIRPDIYAVNEDGDKPEKRAFCTAHGLEYLVLKRLPKPGLPRRQSTALRGF